MSARLWRRGELQAETRDRLEELQRQARDEIAELEGLLKDLKSDPRTEKERDRDEARAARLWEGAKLMLEAGIPPADVVEELASHEDRGHLDALETYLPFWVKGAENRNAV